MNKIYKGHLSVVSILENGCREIYKIYVNKSKRSKIIGYALSLAHQKGIEIELLADKEFKQLGIENSGGIACLASNKKQLTVVNKEFKMILLIEGVEDPYNIGNLLRSAYISGFEAVIFDQKRFAEQEDIILKSSAGCFDRLYTYNLDCADNVINDCNYHFLALNRSDKSILINQFHFDLPLVLCLGGEKRGLSQKILQRCQIELLLDNFSDIKLAYSSVAAGAIAMYYISSNIF